MAGQYSTFEGALNSDAQKGSAGVAATPFEATKRQRMNGVAIALNVLLPWSCFTLITAALSFLHFSFPRCVHLTVAVGAVVSLSLAVLAVRTKQRELSPMWYTFAAATFLLATVLAALVGNVNYWVNMQPYLEAESLSTYNAVDPFLAQGDQFMDAGRVYFQSTATLDFSKSMAFRNGDHYCVAPIVKSNYRPTSYDFWAIGLNCCEDNSTSFQCGQYNDAAVSAGLRLIRQDQRPFFRLAVEQAEAAYGIKADHPLFFTWMKDPLAEVESFRNAGYRTFIISSAVHLLLSIFLVSLAVVGFSRIGRPAC